MMHVSADISKLFAKAAWERSDLLILFKLSWTPCRQLSPRSDTFRPAIFTALVDPYFDRLDRAPLKISFFLFYVTRHHIGANYLRYRSVFYYLDRVISHVIFASLPSSAGPF